MESRFFRQNCLTTFKITQLNRKSLNYLQQAVREKKDLERRNFPGWLMHRNNLKQYIYNNQLEKYVLN